MKLLTKTTVKATGHESLMGFFKSWIGHVMETPVQPMTKKEFLEWLACYSGTDQIYASVAKLEDDLVFWPVSASAEAEQNKPTVTVSMTYQYEQERPE